MGRRGPPPTPTAILKQRGSWRANERPNEPVVGDDKIVAPDWLSKDAKKHWKQIEKILNPIGVLKNSDVPALAILVDDMAKYLTLRKQYEDHYNSEPVQMVAGQFVENPLARHVERAHDRVVKLLKEFGMTPSSRAGIEAGPPVIIQDSQVVVERDKKRFFPA